MEKKSKYDTNPLDPDFPQRAEEQDAERAAEAVRARETQGRPRPTAESEAPTRNIEQPLPTSYPSVFIPPQPPQTTTSVPAWTPPDRVQPLTSRHIPGINLPENVALLLPYIPFYIGAVLAVVELLMLPRSEMRARFHAAQGLSLHLTVLAFRLLLGGIAALVGSSLGSWLLAFAATIFFIISIIRVWKGEPHHIAPLDDLTEWFNEKIAPRK